VSSLVVNGAPYSCWQGEGPSAGVRAAVVRLMGCNLSCAWVTPDGVSPCDEAQTWDARRFNLAEQGTRAEAADIAKAALASRPRLVIITGGEPLLHQHQDGFAELVWTLATAGVRIEVETNGTQLPDAPACVSVDQFNVSPKLASSGMTREKAANGRALAWFTASRRAVFKFVVTGRGDLAEIEDGWIRPYGLHRDQVWVMPAGTTPDAILETARAVAPAALARGFNLTLRQHVLIYDQEGEPR
jgi:organic radical activating enzyme